MGTKQQVVVIGGGIVGLSVAAELSARVDVTVLEAEAQPAYHSSGRSAATYIEPYLNTTVLHLTQASLPFFRAPPAGFSDGAMVSERGGLMLARTDQVPVAAQFLTQWGALCPDIHEISPAQALQFIPYLKQEYLGAVLFDPLSLDLNVHGLIEGHRKRLLANGGQLHTAQRVIALEHRGQWRLRTETGGAYQADVVVNAAGAWGDVLGALVGAQMLGLVPKRRTACLIDAPPGADTNRWPIVHDFDFTFYFKPESGRLMVSPADATPSEPCDAQPDELDVAIAIDRVQRAADLPVMRIPHRWAGLRSFVKDNAPVVGYDEQVPNFFWLVGQGGFGVQTSPALSAAAANLLLEDALPESLTARGLTKVDLGPKRLLGDRAGRAFT